MDRAIVRRRVARVAFQVCGVAMIASQARAASLLGSEDATAMVTRVIAACPGSESISYAAGGSDRGELAMILKTQQIAPMARFLDTARTCGTARPEESEGILVALDAVSVVVNDATAVACPGAAVAGARSIPVADVNGVPGLQCPGCAEDGAYTLVDWKDSLRILYAGMPSAAGSDLAGQDCNSDLRRALASRWDAGLGGACAAGGCVELRHLWRPNDRAGTTEILLALLGLPRVPSSVFCNGVGAGPFADPQPANAKLTDFLDNDPIRRPCQAGETVCGRDGTLGLVLPVDVSANVPSTTLYPPPCQLGKFMLLPPNAVGDTAITTCPNGAGLTLGKCWQPFIADAAGNFVSASCTAGSSPVQGIGGAGLNGKAYNLYVKAAATGRYLKDTRGRYITGAFFRAHATSILPGGSGGLCQKTSSAEQIGCLTRASPCSAGVGATAALAVSGATSLSVKGIAPSVENIRKLTANPDDATAYPLATRIMVNSFVGFDAVTSSAEANLASCFTSRNIVETAALASGLITLGRSPPCVDFDERLCGGGGYFNRNACMKRFLNFCPDVNQVTAAPLQVAVGGDITVTGLASDFEGDALEVLWTAPAGSFANPHLGSTTYRCATEGSQVLTFRVWDGLCETDYAVPVVCAATP